MAISTNKMKVFLCHSSGDKDRVQTLCSRLKDDGFDPWLDTEKLIPGQDWRYEISKAVRETDAILICLSNGSINKEGYVQKEIGKALDVADEKPEGTIFLIPAKFENCSIPDRLSHLQYVELFEDDGHERLLTALKFRAEVLGKRLGGDGRSPKAEEGNTAVKTLPSKGEYELVRIPGGEFWMGSLEGEEGYRKSEGPRRWLKIEDFYLGRYPVTRREYAEFMRADPYAAVPKFFNDHRYKNPRQPIVGISWEDANRYCEWAGLRLPTEAEWEYACRARTETKYHSGNSIQDLDQVGWYNQNSGKRLHTVGEKEPNDFGLYDMHGNIWEWVEDDDHDNYERAPKDGAAWVNDPRGANRVNRGGSFDLGAVNCRSACRGFGPPGFRGSRLGFRPARSIP